jgi:hypothetical protein
MKKSFLTILRLRSTLFLQLIHLAGKFLTQHRGIG